MLGGLSTRSIEYSVLKKFLTENRHEYQVEEDDKEMTITFSPAAPTAKGKLGSSTYMKVLGRKAGEMVEIVRLTVIEEDGAADVSVESLDGWLDFVKNVY